MKITAEMLMAYVDGELDPAAADHVKKAIAADPGLKAQAESARALRNRLRQAYAPVLDEPIPDRLLRAARAPGTDETVHTLRPARGAIAGQSPRRRLPRWAALAASLFLGVLLAPLFSPTDGLGVDLAQGPPVAAGNLAYALENQLAADEPTAGVSIGISFRSHNGEYCRTFSTSAPAPLAGLACRETGGWRLSAIATAASPSGEFRQASTSLPPAILAEVDGLLDGDALDARQERRARATGWQ